MANQAKPDPEENIYHGLIVRDRWMIFEKIGRGGFGAVFEVFDLCRQETYAMKIESTKKKNQVLKVEVTVLRLLKGKLHACKFIGCGKTDNFNYIVMSLSGKNLSELRKQMNTERFSIITTMILAIQAVQSIADLHSVGYLHRDIKPSNFSMGRKNNDNRTLFMLDFGLARQYVAVDGSGRLRPPRPAAGFRGTIRYASINAHSNNDLGRHDDCWSLFYMLVEFLVGKLPWRKSCDKAVVRKMKAETNYTRLLAECPSAMELFLQHLLTMTFYDEPDYAYLIKICKEALTSVGGTFSSMFDWEHSQCPPDTQKVASSLLLTGQGKTQTNTKGFPTILGFTNNTDENQDLADFGKNMKNPPVKFKQKIPTAKPLPEKNVENCAAEADADQQQLYMAGKPAEHNRKLSSPNEHLEMLYKILEKVEK